MTNVVIIGGGLSACLLTIQLLRSSKQEPFRVTIIDKHPHGRLGDAFCTEKAYHLLNSPVGKMSAYADRPDDLLEWLTKEGYSYSKACFIPRKIYKRYIIATLEKENQQRQNVLLQFVHAEAKDIDLEKRLVLTETGLSLPADKVVLAIGNFPPAIPRLSDNNYVNHPHYYGSAWNNDLFATIDRHEPVLILGTGLTMVDVVLLLQERRHMGGIFALSTHGYLPVVHKYQDLYPAFYQELKDQTGIANILAIIRRHIRKAETMNIDWRAVIDSLRPFTHLIWGNLSAAEKTKFMEHLRHIWGVARHRMPPENAFVIQSLLHSGQLRILKGRITSLSIISSNNLRTQYNSGDSKEKKSIETCAVVNCMGPASNYYKIEQPFLKNLLNKGLIQADMLKLGINCTPDGYVIDRKGQPSDFLFTVGPPAKGILWESTAIPEIRSQAQLLALALTRQVEVGV